MSTWADGTLYGFDLETDSPNPEDARIITACVGVASPDGWQAATWLLEPERDIPEQATAVHGITTEMARIDGAPREVSVQEIADQLAEAWTLGLPVVGHNIVYDLTVLDRELRRLGREPLTIDGPVIDTLVLDKAVDRYRRGSRKLADVAAFYGFGQIDAHDAEADVRAACRVAWRIAKSYAEVGQMGLRDLHIFQVEQFEAQRRSFAEYRRRKGEPLDDESTDWPLRPYAEQVEG